MGSVAQLFSRRKPKFSTDSGELYPHSRPQISSGDLVAVVTFDSNEERSSYDILRKGTNYFLRAYICCISSVSNLEYFKGDGNGEEEENYEILMRYNK